MALRGVLAGMGQLLLIADRLRNKTGAGEDAPQAPTPGPAETATNSTETAAAPAPAPAAAATATPAAEAPPAAAAAPPAAAPALAATPAAEAPAAETPAPKRRDYNKTGNVRLLTDKDTEPERAASPVASEAAGSGVSVAEAPAAAQADLPLPNYDDLSVASLRARLRTLTSAQVAELAEYERTHAARAEVITMFERRIAKLEAGG